MSLRDALPDASSLERASACELVDATGNKVSFGSIIGSQKTVVVFVRHFFCGSCQMYVEQLADVPQTALDAAGTKIVVIGCGEHQALAHYKEATSYNGLIYANPDRKLYHALGMDKETYKVAPAGEQTPSYVTRGYYANVWYSISNAILKAPSLIGKQGNPGQLGGDFIFGPGNECTLAHRMQHAQDHIEVADLMKAAGVTLP
ncbi:AhpC/TSA antioxidant enzyme-domain-containing protein [Favolaschia claudopus]|uniref:AhpC/TSA antioxidant enzyme-domain-containing protein n=1 Tax=Favolaschia claudopus TaxID=2862362 RepID=A0AAW0AT30_9AGAR